MHPGFEEIIERVSGEKKKRIIISGRKDSAAVASLLAARDRGWIEPVACGESLSELREDAEVHFIDSDLRQSRKVALTLLKEKKAEAMLDMGPLDDTLFSLLNGSDTWLRRSSLLSYVSVFIAPKDGRLTLLTDTLINSNPRLKDKIAIVENAIQVAKSLGVPRPNIAALGPLELVNPAIPSTLDAAILSKMSERKQFGEVTIEGPLGMDNAESALAARRKGIESPVPGNVDIYLFPDIESASLSSQFIGCLRFFQMGGILAGTRFPIIIRSPLESPDSWLLNIALGLIANRGI